MKILHTLVLCCLLSYTSFCQHTIDADILLANKYYNTGDSLLMAAKYNSAINYFEKAAVIYKNAEDWKKHFNSRNKLAKGYLRIQQYDQALQIAEDVLNKSVTKLGENNLAKVEAYYNMGEVHSRKREYEKALAYQHQALGIYKVLPNKSAPIVASIYNSLGGIQRMIYRYDSALFYYNKVLAIRKKEEDTTSMNMSSIYNNIGNVYSETGKLELSREYFFKSLVIKKDKLNQYHPSIASSYINIGFSYYKMGASDLALEYYTKALYIQKEWYGEMHFSIARTCNFIGNSYLGMGNYEMAIDFYKKGLAISRELFGDHHLHIAIAYNNIGIVYSKESNHKEALGYYQKAITIFKAKPEENQIYLSYPYENIAGDYVKQQLYALAITYYQKSIALRKTFLPEKNESIALSYNSMGEVFQEKKDYAQSLAYYQKALIANVHDFSNSTIYSNPPLIRVLNQTQLLSTLKNKMSVLEKFAAQTNPLKNLKRSFSTLLLCDTLINQMRQSYLKYEDKKTLAKTASEVYEGAVRISLNLHDKTNDNSYLEHAFYFAEKNKSGILTESLNALTAKNAGLLPNNLMDFEQNLKINQAFYQSQVNELQVEKDGYDTALLQYNQGRLFTSNRQYDSLVLALESDYPDYYRMKYKNTTISPDKIQQKLPEKTALIEYFEGDNSLYTFVITREGYKMFSTPIASDFQDQIAKLRNNLDQSRKEALSVPVKEFISVTNKLGDKLLSKPLAYLSNQVNIDHLVIIPDGKLSYIPFELLPTNEIKEDQKNFKQLPYLINDYSISYGYSSSLIFNQTPQKKDNYSSSYIGYAPAYATNLKNSSLAIAGKFRDEITSLAWNQDEVLNIAKEMNGSGLVAAAATETSFKKIAKDHGVLHLAMHALVDNEEPMNSKLVFNQSNDPLNDGFLHAYEIFNMELNAQMVVLSACNTGFGKLEKGEGVASLGYAFSYAGCPSVVMSHWPVNDYSTKEIMLSFYHYLEAGYAKDKALQLAKIDFLKTAEGELANPAYWAPFVLIGNDDPIELQENNSAKFILVFLAIAAFLTLFLFLIYTNNKSRHNLTSA